MTKIKTLIHHIYLALAFMFLFSMSAYASPATMAMMDGSGCHACKRICKKFGLEKGQHHCHVFSPEAMQLYEKALNAAATNSEEMYASHILKGIDYVTLNSTKTELLIVPIKKQIEGEWSVVSQSCGFGESSTSISPGKPAHFKKVFGAHPSAKGLYSIKLHTKEFLGIATKNQRLLVVDTQDNILCGGQFIREKLYLFCRATVSGQKNIGTSGYCRTSFRKN